MLLAMDVRGVQKVGEGGRGYRVLAQVSWFFKHFQL
jgi:hypothetical protein